MKKILTLLCCALGVQLIQAHDIFDQLSPTAATEMVNAKSSHFISFNLKNHKYHLNGARALKYFFVACLANTDEENCKENTLPAEFSQGLSLKYPDKEYPGTLKALSAIILTDFLCTNYTQPLVDSKMENHHWLIKHSTKAAARIAVYSAVRNSQELTSAGYKNRTFEPKLYIPILAFES